ncbi:hypothetical protein [Coxiella-like endosymbiont]|nr:hypothetical protein [Coxiella-like endosymbiont]
MDDIRIVLIKLAERLELPYVFYAINLLLYKKILPKKLWIFMRH